MPPFSIRPQRTTIWLPPSTQIYGKLTITDDSGVVHTLMDSYSGLAASNYCLDASVTRTVGDSLGTFKCRIINDLGRFFNKFNGGEVVNFYCDYVDGTTLIFRGKVDNVQYGLNKSDGWYVEIDGRDYPEMADKTITGEFEAELSSVSLAKLLSEEFSDVTLSFWNGSAWVDATYDNITNTVSWSDTATGYPTTLINMTFQHNKGWTVIKNICDYAELDCYLEYTTKWCLRVSVRGTIKNTNAGIAYGVNLLGMSEYGIDTTEIKNRVFVYGKQESDNIILLKTEEDTASQANLWIKDLVVNDTNLTGMNEVQSRANSELALNTSETTNGRLTALLLPSLKPGDMIQCSVPYTGLAGSFKVQKFTHTFGDKFTTSVDLAKKIKTMKDLFVKTYNPDELGAPTSNINSMKDSYTVFFDEDPSIVSLTNCNISNKQVRLDTGTTAGQVVSNVITADYDATECEFRRYENMYTNNDTYEVTNDGGATWETYATSGDTHVFSNPGKSLAFRMTLNRVSSVAPSPVYESVCLLYK